MKKIILSLLVLLVISFAFKARQKTNIWLVGDSTMASKRASRAPESGWGEGLKEFVKRKAVVHNHAASGRSSRSFVDENRWEAVLDSIQPGDYVIIQFGHNDEKPKPKLHTDPFTSYKQFLKKFIDETRSKGGTPIICSSIIRRQFDHEGKLKDTHGDYIKASREAAMENNACFVDLEAETRQLVTDLGPEKSKVFFVKDGTHVNFEGARKVAEIFIEDIKKQELPLAKFFKK